MIDFLNLDASALADAGIRFRTEKETDDFIRTIVEELEVRVGEAVSKGKPEDVLELFESAQTDEEQEAWLDRYCPEYRDIVRSAQQQMEKELIQHRDEIPGNVFRNIGSAEGKDTPFEAISQSELESHIADSERIIRKTCRTFRRGLLSEDERKIRIQDCFMNNYVNYLDSKNLKIRIAASDWAGFPEAIQNYRNSGRPDNLPACSWLHFIRSDTEHGIKGGDEASILDKMKVIRLMDVFHVPFEYYRPVPEGIVCPDCMTSRYANEYYVGWYIWEDDGGLTKDDFHLGDTITLTDRHGLKARIRVDRKIDKSIRHPESTADYVGTGTVEGYTSARPREIQIYVKDHKISCLYFRRDEDDFGFDLWKDYYEDRKTVDCLYDQIMDDLISAYSST